MMNATIAALEDAQLRKDLPEFRVGDTIRVHYKIVEGDKERVQVYQGVVIKRHRAGARSSFTVRKVSFGVGVERIFQQHSPRIDKIEAVSRGVVRRSRLFYLRDLSGKAARLKNENEKLSLTSVACSLPAYPGKRTGGDGHGGPSSRGPHPQPPLRRRQREGGERWVGGAGRGFNELSSVEPTRLCCASHFTVGAAGAAVLAARFAG